MKSIKVLLRAILSASCFIAIPSGYAQKPMLNIERSAYAIMKNVGLDEVTITGGFWKERQEVNRNVSLEILWEKAADPENGFSFNNFKIAAGLKEGTHQGVAWQDAWMYKWIEAASYDYIVSGNETLIHRMDEVIPVIAKAQEADGYIATQVSAGKFPERWMNPGNHELYNMGHLMTAAAVNYRLTGREDLLDVANKAAAFCLKQFREHPELMWEYPLNPSIIMGSVALYRSTGNQDGLELAKHIVDLRGSKYQPEEVNSNWGRPEWGEKERYQGGTDLYQNFIPLRKEKEVLGHAVFFTYLYAGATDVFLETGDTTLLKALEHLWSDLTEKKMYVTGGVSPVHKAVVTRSFTDGKRQVCRWDPIHEGIVAPFDLPNATAYNETCGMVGNMMWNWRMLQATGDPRYAEVMELSWYNSILTGVELDGSKWSYTNPLRWHGEEHELWSHDYHERHVPGLRHICCPTNVLRNIAAYQGYLFSESENKLWVHHYAEAKASLTNLDLGFKMETEYPWDGRIRIKVTGAPKKRNLEIKLRIPSWATNNELSMNGKKTKQQPVPGTYISIKREWKKGDVIELNLGMETQLLAGDPRSEHIRNQVAVKRGPVVYCLESNDIDGNVDIESIALDAGAAFTPEYRSDLLGGITVLKTTAFTLQPNNTKKMVGQYHEIARQSPEEVEVKLIPYFSWNNRQEPEMSVWLPVNW